MNASVLSRLALALLVALGFVVPRDVPVRDEVTQGVARELRAASAVAARDEAPRLAAPEHGEPTGYARAVTAGRLYVRHRALLL